jgi:hypothetical protein
MDLTVLPGRLKLRKGHGFLHQPPAARLGDQVPGSELLAVASSTVGYETRLCLPLASCGQASIVTPVDQPLRVSHAIRVWNSAFDSWGDGIYGIGESSRNRHHSFAV